MNEQDDWLRAILRASAPQAIPLIEDNVAMVEIKAVYYPWALSVMSADQAPRVTAAALFGSSKGSDRKKSGALSQLEEMKRQLEQIENLAAETRASFAWASNDFITPLAYQFHAAIAAARDNVAQALAALLVIDDELAKTKKKFGPGSLADKQRGSFDEVAREVMFQWRRMDLPKPVGNKRDGGLIDLLDALHQEAGAGPLKSIPALMAKLR
ncbi:hypothetical protein [Paracoccus sp. SY]|uniref:hypothetical protein n=1 Tax=Paracoccus sp. SY TaxID=1330255 RepID=UPI000CD01E45|nr:hypothetical protein [Paracoccus sp. SY]